MKIWMLPSYKPQTPSSQMRVYRIAEKTRFKTTIIPHNWTIDKKHETLKESKSYDYILIQKWRNDFNKAEYISQLTGTKIFDVDDLTGDQDAIDLGNACDIIFCANHFLLNWAKAIFPNKRHFLVPTGVDIPSPIHPYNKNRHNIVLPKYGVDRYIKHVAKLGIWEQLYTNHNIALRILGTTEEASSVEATKTIGDFCKCYPLVPLNEFWNNYGKIISSAAFGIMPLGKNAQGKSAFSVLTMMASGLPVVASPYGECDFIIENGKNGFLANTNKDWLEACESLLTNTSLRQKMSIEAVKTIIKKYTIEKVVQTIEEHLGLS